MEKFNEISEIQNKNLYCSRSKQNRIFYMSNPHYHNHYEIYYLLSGKRKYFIENKVYELSKGDIVLIPKNKLHRTVMAENMQHQRLLVSFNDKMLFTKHMEDIDKCFSTCYYHPPEALARTISMLFSKIEREYNKNDKFSEDLIKGYLNELFVVLVRNHEKFIYYETDYSMNTMIKAIVEYISVNFYKDLTLTSIAANFNVSPEHLSRQFKNNTGFNVIEYLTLLRIQQAEVLLQNKSLTITDIAFQCGFNDSNYFSTVFKKTTGISPRKFRYKSF